MPDKADVAMDGEIPIGEMGQAPERIGQFERSGKAPWRRSLGFRDGDRYEPRSAGCREATPALERWQSSGELGATPFLLDGVFRGLAANAGVGVPGDVRDRSKRGRTAPNTRLRNVRTRATLGAVSNVLYNAGGRDWCGELPNNCAHARLVAGPIPTFAECAHSRTIRGYAHIRDISGMRTFAVYCAYSDHCGCADPVYSGCRP